MCQRFPVQAARRLSQEPCGSNRVPVVHGNSALLVHGYISHVPLAVRPKPLKGPWVVFSEEFLLHEQHRRLVVAGVATRGRSEVKRVHVDQLPSLKCLWLHRLYRWCVPCPPPAPPPHPPTCLPPGSQRSPPGASCGLDAASLEQHQVGGTVAASHAGLVARPDLIPVIAGFGAARSTGVVHGAVFALSSWGGVTNAHFIRLFNAAANHGCATHPCRRRRPSRGQRPPPSRRLGCRRWRTHSSSSCGSDTRTCPSHMIYEGDKRVWEKSGATHDTTLQHTPWTHRNTSTGL